MLCSCYVMYEVILTIVLHAVKILEKCQYNSKGCLKGKETLRYKDFCKGKIQHMKLLQT